MSARSPATAADSGDSIGTTETRAGAMAGGAAEMDVGKNDRTAIDANARVRFIAKRCRRGVTTGGPWRGGLELRAYRRPSEYHDANVSSLVFFVDASRHSRELAGPNPR